ncbi:MAG: GNAT family N-acetyltransferase [Proteobacteria bacterium]|nr:GNAT family N-acetyltransferase [Pseudomonadota bacterium]MBI3498527.1 GNAT family N-acetyltransferase [Pseudomonadota bacterium]
MAEILIRPAHAADADSVARLIAANAGFHGKPEMAKLTPGSVRRDGFGAEPLFWAYLAENHTEPVGIAQFYFIYRGWTGSRAIYVSDLFVEEAARGQGIGRRLMAAVARRAKEAGCGGLSLGVRNDNPARHFYERLGMSVYADSVSCRLEGEALARLAAEID